MKQNQTFYQPHRLNPRRTRAIFWILAPLVLMSMAASAARADIVSLQVGAYQSTPTLVGPGDSYTVQFWSKLKADESHVENLYDTGETWTISSVKYSDDDVNWQTIWNSTPVSSVTLGFPYYSSFTLSGGVGGASLDASTQPTTAAGFYMITVSDKADYTATVNGKQTSGTTPPVTASSTKPLVKITKVTVGSPTTQTNMLQDKPNQGDINYGVVKKSSGKPLKDEKCVIQTVANAKATATTDPATTKVEDKIVWPNGTAVSGGKNTERNYSLAKSQKLTINPTLAGRKWAGHNVYLWVIWSTVTVKFEGNISANDKAGFLNNGKWPTGQDPTNLFLGGGTGLGPIDKLTNSDLLYAYTVGKYEASAHIQPVGVWNVVKDDASQWYLFRHVHAALYENGAASLGSPFNTMDNSKYIYECPTPTDNNGGTIYDLDTPTCRGTPQPYSNVNHTAETYDNFLEWARLTLDKDYQISDRSKFYYHALVDDDAKRIDLNKLDTGNPELPSSPHYTKR